MTHSATVIVRMTPEQKEQLGLLSGGSGMSSWIRDRIDEAFHFDPNKPFGDPTQPPAAPDIDLRVSQALGWVEKRISEMDLG